MPADRQRRASIRSAFELARTAIGEAPRIGSRLTGASDVWLHMRARLAGLPAEEFWTIALDVRHRVLFDERCGLGSLTGVEVHPRDIFRRLLKAGAAAAIFCHNHPSGVMRTPTLCGALAYDPTVPRRECSA